MLGLGWGALEVKSMVYIPSIRWKIIEFGGNGWFSSRPKNCSD